VNIPRKTTDLKMTSEGFAAGPPLVRGMDRVTKATDGSDVMMGDLVLLQEEVESGSVRGELLDNGIGRHRTPQHIYWDDRTCYT